VRKRAETDTPECTGTVLCVTARFRNNKVVTEHPCTATLTHTLPFCRLEDNLDDHNQCDSDGCCIWSLCAALLWATRKHGRHQQLLERVTLSL
jgi:hypothetical protein